MASPAPLDEDIQQGDLYHALRHSDANYWINRLLEMIQLGGQDTSAQQWLLVVPETQAGKGFVVRLNAASLFSGFEVQDHNGAAIFDVLPSGGAGVTSANAAADGLWVSNDTTGRAGFWNTNGGVRLVKGDPGGGREVLALGDVPTAGTAPSSNPDGSHTAETGFTTVAGAVVWGPKDSGGRLHWRSRAGHEDELAAPVMRRQARIDAPGGGTSLVVTGTAAPTVATTNITAAADDTAAGPGVSYTTTAASAVDAGIISAFGLLQRRWSPYFYAKITTDGSAITSTRLAVGLVSADIASNAGPAASGAYTTAAGAFIRYDSGVDTVGANWRCVTSDGANCTVTVTTAAIAAATTYELRIEVDAAGTTFRFYINAVGSAPTLVATHTTTLPGTSTALGYIGRLRTLTTSARAFRLIRMAWSAL